MMQQDILGSADLESSVTSPSRMVWSEVRKQHAALMGLAMVLIVVIVALFAPIIAPHDPDEQNLALRRQPSTADSPFGRDAFGRDILSRIVSGSRATLSSGFTAVLVSALIGSFLGILAGYRGGLTEAIAMRGIDLILAFPYFLLAILIVATFGPGLRNATLAVAIVYVPTYARVVRGAVLEVKQLEYVEAARVAGVRESRIVWTHVVPNILAPILVLSTVGMAIAVINIAALSFLGLGARPPASEWGAMISEGRQFITSAPHISLFPGLAIMWTVLGFNLLGDGLRDILDPRLKT